MSVGRNGESASRRKPAKKSVDTLIMIRGREVFKYLDQLVVPGCSSPSQSLGRSIFLYYVIYICNGVEWSKDRTQAAESIKWRPQQAYGSSQVLLAQLQTIFSTPTKSSLARIDKRTAWATGNTCYHYSKIAPLDHKMADDCVSLARTNTLSSTITKPIKTWKTSNKSYSYNLLNHIKKCTHMTYFIYNKSGKRGLCLSTNRFVQLNHH